MASRALLITGATGKQGSSVINALLKSDTAFEILALTRDPKTASAQKLLQKSPRIKLVTGNLNAIDDIFANARHVASTPIWGVFSVQIVGKNEEIEGKKLVDAALRNGVSHFIYTSVDRGFNSDTDSTNVPHFIAKYNIEQHLIAKAKGSNMSWTVFRPVAFFDNLTPDFFGKVFTTSILLRLGEQRKKLQLVATSDIGFYAAQAFLNPKSDEYVNKSVSLAGDELSFSQMKTIFEQKTGQTLPTTYLFVASVLHWLSHDFRSMFNWFRDVGFGVDIAKMRKRNPDLKDFGTWLETESAWKKS